MSDEINTVKKKLTEAISQLSDVSWMFLKDGKWDFIRKRKLPFDKVISFLLAMEGGSLTNEMARDLSRIFFLKFNFFKAVDPVWVNRFEDLHLQIF